MCSILLSFTTCLQSVMWTIGVIYVIGLCWPLLCAVEADKFLEHKGRIELQRVRVLAEQPPYGECWSRALEKIQSSCREFTDEMQSKIALAFTHCHLRRSDRPFPECPEGSEVRVCTRGMDPVAFNTYTEFFTHAHSICHYLQSERWQQRAENTIHRLTESSAGVAEQLASTQQMTEDLMEAQSAALKAQETILRNGEELKHTLVDSTQGMREVFAEMRHSAQEQQVAFAEIFNRVAFLQSFIMSESHTLSCLLYNTLGLCTAFLLTSAQRTAGARFFLFGLVALNVYLERMICRSVLENAEPGYQQMERIALLVGFLRKAMVLIGLLVLVYFAVRFRNVNRESLEILSQLKETHLNLQQALQQAECLSEAADGHKGARPEHWRTKLEKREEDNLVILYPSSTLGPASPSSSDSHGTSASPRRRQRPSSDSRRRPPSSSSSSALVYSVLVDDTQPRYSLRSRKSLSGPVANGN